MQPKELGRITDVFLGKEDRGILTFMLYVEYDSYGSQGFGGYQLDHSSPTKKDPYRRVPSKAYKSIQTELCTLFNIQKFEDLKGKVIWVYTKDGLIEGIQPTFLHKQPFYAKEWAERQ